eukprot:3272334-Rhodomonas_salina.2
MNCWLDVHQVEVHPTAGTGSSTSTTALLYCPSTRVQLYKRLVPQQKALVQFLYKSHNCPAIPPFNNITFALSLTV